MREPPRARDKDMSTIRERHPPYGIASLVFRLHARHWSEPLIPPLGRFYCPSRFQLVFCYILTWQQIHITRAAHHLPTTTFLSGPDTESNTKTLFFSHRPVEGGVTWRTSQSSDQAGFEVCSRCVVRPRPRPHCSAHPPSSLPRPPEPRHNHVSFGTCTSRTWWSHGARVRCIVNGVTQSGRETWSAHVQGTLAQGSVDPGKKSFEEG
jgi:hypothetical protein